MERPRQQPGAGLSYIEISTYEELVDVLREASEIEHMLMCQYLFAAYSLKRSREEGLGEVEVERARRWGSRITLVARQEMEHLGLVLNMMSAIGTTPHLGRPEFPQGEHYYSSAAALPMVLTPFSVETLQRFEDFEAPHLEHESLAHWCDPPPPGAAPTDARGRLQSLTEQLRGARKRKPSHQLRAGQSHFDFTSVQELYVTLWHGLERVEQKLGRKGKALFVGSPGAQIFGGPDSPFHGTMNDLNQYGLDIVPVRDLATARQAIAIILLQGEGVVVDGTSERPGPESYRQYTHYCLFRTTREELEKRPIEAARRVVENPRFHRKPLPPRDQKVNLITDPMTWQVGDAFNQSYQLMLRMLVSLYGNQDWELQLSQQLTDAVFFPMMTMFVRPLAEVLTQLPAFENDGEARAGPAFELTGRTLLPIPRDQVWQVVLDGLRELRARLQGLSILEARDGARYPKPVRERLTEIGDNVDRLLEDWRNNWQNIGRD
jgi:hypothetical protein